MAEYITYTADDEEPKCGRCDNADMPSKYCVMHCGSENAWNGYCRTEMSGTIQRRLIGCSQKRSSK